MNTLKRIFVGFSLGTIIVATFQFLQIIGLLSLLSLKNQYLLQFQVKPWFGLILGILQFAILVSIRNKYLQHRKREKAHLSFRKTKRSKLLRGYGFTERMDDKIVASRVELYSNEQSKRVCSIFSIWEDKKDKNGWYNVFPPPTDGDIVVRKRVDFNSNQYVLPKVFPKPFTYQFKEKLSWDQNISKVKFRYYLYSAITILSPIYHVVINFAYLLGMTAKAMELLWQYPSLFSIVFLLEIIFTGNILSQTSGDSIL